MKKELILVTLLLFAVIGIAVLFPDQVRTDEKVQEQLFKPTYELELISYTIAVSQIQDDIDYCDHENNRKNYIVAAEKFQAVMKKGNLTEVKSAIKELSSVAYSIPVREKRIHSDISETEKDLLQKIEELESKNETVHPVRYHYELINDSSYCEIRTDEAYPSGGADSSSSSGSSSSGERRY
jgi:soluble cytochrome b562